MKSHQSTQSTTFDAISLVRVRDIANKELDEVKPIVIRTALKRKVNITVHKPIKAIQKMLGNE